MERFHPVFQKMKSLGCENQQHISMAFQTYIELCEVYAENDVNYDYCSELDMIYVTTKENECNNFYLPVFARDSLSTPWLDRVTKVFSGLDSSSRIHLMIRERDSSHVDYLLSDGLIKPALPEDLKKKKEATDKRKIIEKEYRLMKNVLFEKATTLTS